MSKAEQVAEGQRRVEQGVIPRDSNPVDVNTDAGRSAETTGADAETITAEPGAQETREAPPQRQDPRSDIYARFRAKRAVNEAAEDVAELRAFAHQGVPPEITAQSEPEVEQQAPQEQQEQQDQPLVIKRVLRVRGQDVDLSAMPETDIIAALQKGLAGDSYLDEAREKADLASASLQRVNTLLQQTEQRVRGPAAEHPGAQTTGTPNSGETDVTGEHPAADAVDPWVDAVKQIQFEDSETAAKSLKTMVEGIVKKEAKQGAQETLREDRRADELGRNRRTLEDLRTNHPDIAKDPKAVAAVKTDIAAMQHADLLALGFTEAQLPDPTDQKELGRWHLHYRSEGAKVRPMNDIMEKAISEYRAWKGTPAETPAETVPAKPRVVVKLDRTERRETIPQQPNRSVAPRPDSAQPQQRPRSAVVAAMAQARMGPRGRVVA